MCDRLKAAVDARRDDDFVIMARTDAFAREGRAAALDRAAAYVAAGADMIFAEALHTLDDYAAFTRAIDVPVLANLTEFGLTPYFTVAELERAGVKLVLYPLSAFRAMSRAAQRRLRGDSRAKERSAACSTSMQTRERAVCRARLSRVRAQARRAVRSERRQACRPRANRRAAGASAESARASSGGASARRGLARLAYRRQRRVVDELERRVVAEAEQIERIVGRRIGRLARARARVWLQCGASRCGRRLRVVVRPLGRRSERCRDEIELGVAEQRFGHGARDVVDRFRDGDGAHRLRLAQQVVVLGSGCRASVPARASKRAPVSTPRRGAVSAPVGVFDGA